MEDINSPCELQNHSEDEMRMTTTYPNSPMMLESDMKDIIFNFQQTIGKNNFILKIAVQFALIQSSSLINN